MDTVKKFDTRTIVLRTPKGNFLRVLTALTHQSKNLYNSSLYLIRQVFTAYEYDRLTKTNNIKSELHDEQANTVVHFNEHINKINLKRIAKFPAKLEKAIKHEKEKLPELKLIPLIEPSTSNLVASLLDSTVLDNVARHKKDDKGGSAYKKLPGVMAQQTCKRLKETFTGFFEATKRYNSDPSSMTGRPKMPGYLDKHGRFVLEIPFVNIHKALPSMKGKEISEDDFVENVQILPPEMIAVYDGYDMIEAIKTACENRGYAKYEPQHLRIVPLKKGVRLELIVRIPNPYTTGSFLAGVVDKHSEELMKCKTQKERDEWFSKHLSKIDKNNLPNIAGIDLGVTNMATVAYSTGDKAAVHTGGRFIANTEEMLKQIGKRVSEITPDRVKELQAKKLALTKEERRLERNEEIELRTLLKILYEDQEYRRLTKNKENWVKDFLHKLSTKIVKDCVNRGIDVIVIGRNKGWKQEVNLGRESNRQFCMIAHATLIRLIKYKADAHGIAVVTTEESYTSKTSFVNGDELECYAKKQTQDVSTASPVKTGYRSSTDRNWFCHKNKSKNDRMKWVHADVNGAFNIIRKVFVDFKYNDNLSLKFTLMRLSTRLGVVPILLKI